MIADFRGDALAEEIEARGVLVDREGRVEGEGIGFPADFVEDGSEQGAIGLVGVPVALGKRGLVGAAFVDIDAHEFLRAAAHKEVAGAHLEIDGMRGAGHRVHEGAGERERGEELLGALAGGVLAGVEGFLEGTPFEAVTGFGFLLGHVRVGADGDAVRG